MLDFNTIVSLVDNLSIMFLSGLILYGLIEIAKLIWKSEGWRQYVVPVIFVVSFIVYLIISLCKGLYNPIVVALLNSLILVICESSCFTIIKGVGKLITAIANLIKKWIDPDKAKK